jgi:hypothetical protein
MDKNLEQFIRRYLSEYYNEDVNMVLTEDLSIEKDLGIIDEDIDDFLTQFITEFSIDFKRFESKRYFTTESWVFSVFRFFFGQRKWLPLPVDQLETFTIAHLQRAVENGFLI